jgi:hypothetical protein
MLLVVLKVEIGNLRKIIHVGRKGIKEKPINSK